MPESNSNTMDWYRRNKSLLYFITLLILMIVMMLWVSEQLKKHIDRKMPDFGYHDSSLPKSASSKNMMS